MYKDKRGLWRQSVKINGKKKTFSAKTKKDLALKMIQFDIKRKEALTLESVAEGWKEENWEKLRFGSFRTYSPCLNRIIAKFGDKNIDEIKPKEIQLWLKELGETYAQKTVSNHKCVLSQIFDYAIVNLNMDIYNPCDRVKLPSGLKKGTREALSEAERQAVLSTSVSDFQLGFVILFTGCRLGEALALQYRDCDLKNNVIHITKSVGFHGNQPVINPPKTKTSVRTVPLLPPLKQRLKELKLKPTDYLVSGEKPLTKSVLFRRWEKFCKDKKIDIDRHSIRHQYATTLYEAGIDPKSAQELLGHAQISTTMDIYTHISEAKHKQDYIKLANYIEGKRKKRGTKKISDKENIG